MGWFLLITRYFLKVTRYFMVLNHEVCWFFFYLPGHFSVFIAGLPFKCHFPHDKCTSQVELVYATLKNNAYNLSDTHLFFVWATRPMQGSIRQVQEPWRVKNHSSAWTRLSTNLGKSNFSWLDFRTALVNSGTEVSTEVVLCLSDHCVCVGGQIHFLFRSQDHSRSYP